MYLGNTQIHEYPLKNTLLYFIVSNFFFPHFPFYNELLTNLSMTLPHLCVHTSPRFTYFITSFILFFVIISPPFPLSYDAHVHLPPVPKDSPSESVLET